MNNLESRIYADAASAAAEITAADIPPLPLSPGRSRSRRRGMRTAQTDRRGVGRPADSRRWLAALAAAASVVGIIAVVGTVGRWQHAAPSSTVAAARPAPTVSHAQSTLGTEALDQYFPATGSQYTAGLAFDWTKLKISAGIFDSCMANAGFPQPPFSEKEQAYLRSFPNNSQFPDLMQRAGTGSMSGSIYIATSPRVPKSAAGRNANRRCTAASDRPFAKISMLASPLELKWMNAVTAIQASAPVHAEHSSFSACLEAHGIPATYAQQETTAASPLFAGFFAWADHLGQTVTSTRQQTANDHRWTPVFVRCARPTVTVVERLQLATRARFFKQHARQINEIKTLAENLPSAGR